jgi:DNA (cytosine-5)-methyltransferase 1
MGKSFKFIDIFSGCGGFSTGLEMSGHKCLLGVDFNEDAIKSFAHNHKHAKTFFGDIKDLSKSKLESLVKFNQVDMVVGGPPCQGFSTVGKGQADDDRNSLFKEFVRVVRLTDPKIILFENVTGMLAKKNEKTVHKIFKQFERLGYTMDAKVLDSSEFGVPSRRRRTIIMGVKGKTCLYPEISHGPRGLVKFKTVAKAFKKLSSSSGKTYNHDKVTARVKKEIDLKRLKYIPEGCGIRYEKDELAYLPKRLRFDIDWKELREGRFRQTRLQRLNRKNPAPTILTSRTSYYHPTEDRFLTVREAASLQSFPNDFVFQGSLTAQFRQIGNAVPPGLGQSIGESLRQLKFSSVRTKKDLKDKSFASKAFTYKNPPIAAKSK